MSQEPHEPFPHIHQAYLTRFHRVWACIDHEAGELEIFIEIPKAVPADWFERFLVIRATDLSGVLSEPLAVRWTDLTGSVLRCVARDFPQSFRAEAGVRPARIGRLEFSAGTFRRMMLNLYAIDAKDKNDHHDDRLL